MQHLYKDKIKFVVVDGIGLSAF